MVDLADIDRQLEQLGKEPDDCAALLNRALGTDRSLERIDELLATLAQSVLLHSAPPKRRPSSHPPRALGRHARWTPPTAALPGSRPATARDTLVGPPTSHPPASSSPPSGPPASDESELLLSDAGEEGEPVLTFADPREGGELETDTTSSWAAPVDEATERRPSMEALLNQHLDPDDFPKTPPPPAASDDELMAADEDDFELLIDDEEILEVEDDELVDEGEG